MTAPWSIIAIGLQQHIPRGGHMFISEADSDNQRIDYHLTYPSSPRVFSLAYGVAETNNSKI